MQLAGVIKELIMTLGVVTNVHTNHGLHREAFSANSVVGHTHQSHALLMANSVTVARGGTTLR